MRRKLCDVTLCPVGLVHVLQILIVPDLFAAYSLSSLTWVLAFPRSGTACGQQNVFMRRAQAKLITGRSAVD